MTAQMLNQLRIQEEKTHSKIGSGNKIEARSTLHFNPKVEFPTFDGSNLKGRIKKCTRDDLGSKVAENFNRLQQLGTLGEYLARFEEVKALMLTARRNCNGIEDTPDRVSKPNFMSPNPRPLLPTPRPVNKINTTLGATPRNLGKNTYRQRPTRIAELAKLVRASPALSARAKFGDMAGRLEARGPAADGPRDWPAETARLGERPSAQFSFFLVFFCFCVPFFVFVFFIFFIFISLLVLVCLNFFFYLLGF
ncbi:hypothetical protein Cgig2_001164 [Carnegiea gigantea]|uniref:Uncharacterized protein n=1 Tax=Carnegiea gigantea TaxID=171969 RepID=A0A9Q1GGH0_9CARY|nr:hypothetical protein Cgig2_001164 [Carnegiea gigantea]